MPSPYLLSKQARRGRDGSRYSEHSSRGNEGCELALTEGAPVTVHPMHGVKVTSESISK